MESTCCSSDSVDLRAYRQYLVATGANAVFGTNPSGASVLLITNTNDATPLGSLEGLVVGKFVIENPLLLLLRSFGSSTSLY